MNIKALKFRWNGAETRRYHGFRPLMEDTVGHHSHNVISTLLYLEPDCSRNLILAAHDHDAAEHKAGDMPAPTKRNIPGMREAFGKYEAELGTEAGLINYEVMLSPDERYLLKLADSLDGCRFCLNEVTMGNRKMRDIFHTFGDYVCTLLEERYHKRAAGLFNIMKDEIDGIG